METLTNKVAQSGIITLNLEDYYPKNVLSFDLKQFLFMELILKEKDYREALKNFNFEPYQNQIATIHCTADAIIPIWAYMLAAAYLQPIASSVSYGNPTQAAQQVLVSNIQAINTNQFAQQRIVVKGCGEIDIEPQAYIAITAHLQPHAKSIMYGEPCSTVPIYKNKTI
jgi:hypothetical protein